MELKNNIETSEIQETKLNEISGGTFVQDNDNEGFFQADPNLMEDTSWMEDLRNHFTWI